MKFSIIGIILIVVWSAYLLKNLGITDINLNILWDKFWPVILILIGFSMIFKKNPKKENKDKKRK